MPRPLTEAQTFQNDAFLRQLARTGNVREAARALGVHRSTYFKRRAKHPDFAAAWDAALAEAATRLARADAAVADARNGGARIARGAGGRPQLRRPPAGRMTPAIAQAFLAALAATANVRLSAAAAGLSHSAFYARRRADPAFAREMKWALQQGYDRIEAELLAGWSPANPEGAAWRDNDPPPIPPMTAAEALHLLHLHQKEARFHVDRPDLDRRRGEAHYVHGLRLATQYIARLAAEAEDQRLADVLRNRATARLRQPAPTLPALDQVTGWSKASSRPPPRDGRDRG